MIERIPSKAEIVNIVQSQAQTLDNISGRFVQVENSVEKQESRNITVIVAVLIATILIVITIAVQVSISDKRDRERTDNLLNLVHGVETSNVELKGQVKLLEAENSELRKQVDSIKARNPYIK